MREQFTLFGRINSLKHATRGIILMFKSQHNAWLHAVATLLVIITCILFELSRQEWCWIVIAITSVWTAEAMNTSFEFLCDLVSPEFQPLVKNAKDVAAGAVLLTAIGACVVGILIFIPHFF